MGSLIFSEKILTKNLESLNDLTLEALSKIVADNILKNCLIILQRNKTWHFMQIVCWADSSHEMTTVTFLKNYFSEKVKNDIS